MPSFKSTAIVVWILARPTPCPPLPPQCFNATSEPPCTIGLNKAYTILKEQDISIKSLRGYGNFGLRKKDIKPYDDKISVKIKE